MLITKTTIIHRYKRRDQLFGVAITFPAILMLFLLFVFPICYSLLLSFTDYNFVRTNSVHFIGLKNYISAFSDKDFLNALYVTSIIAIGSLTCEFCFGLTLAFLVTKIKRGQGIFKTIYLTPMMVAPTVAGMLFRFVLNDEFGILNTILFETGIIKTSIPWLTNDTFARLSIIIVDSWATIPMMFLLLYTAISNIDSTLLEAAHIDGAGSIRTFFHIQIPVIRRTALLALFIRFMDVFRIYGSIYVMTQGGPGNVTESLAVYIYRVNWQKFKLGYASAMSYIMMIIMFIISLVIQYFSKDKSDRNPLLKRRSQNGKQ